MLEISIALHAETDAEVAARRDALDIAEHFQTKDSRFGTDIVVGLLSRTTTPW